MRLIELHNLFDKERTREIAFEGICHDCKKELMIVITAKENEFNIDGGSVYKVNTGLEYKGEDKYILKCNECFVKNPILFDYQQCEIYSRVVGYLRPIDQWNPGKLQEFKDRKMFDKEKFE